VLGRPVLAVVGASAELLTLAIPTLSLQMAAGALRQFPAGHETRQGFEAASAVTGPGGASQVRVLVAGDTPAALGAAVERAQATLRRDPAIGELTGARPSADGRSSVVTATTREDAESVASKAMVVRVRAALPDAQADDGQLVLEATAPILGRQVSVRARLSAQEGALVIAAEGLLASFGTLTVFKDPRVQVDRIGARPRPDGFTVTAEGQVIG